MKNLHPVLARPIGLSVIAPLLVLLLAFSALWAPMGLAQPTFVNGQAARLVIGQPHFTRQAPISSRETIGGAGGIAIVNNRLFIADGNELGSTPLNNRVLLYDDLSSFIPDLEDVLSQPAKGAAPEEFCPVCVGLPDVVLGQPNFDDFGPARTDGFQNPTSVASDGTMLAVADTDNNRVLIWRTIPTVNGTLPDVVVGQPDFETAFPRTAGDGMRGPQGVWIDGNRLFVADTQNGRVLIFNPVPTANGASATTVLGQPDFDTRPEPDLTQSNVEVTASLMLDPVAVTVSNNRMFVTDLGFNRVMIFLTVPTSNTFPADVVVGQQDFESALANDSTALCEGLPPPPDSNIDIDLDTNMPAVGCMVSEQMETSCNDGLDNDCDGLIDIFDRVDCCVVTQETELSCADGIDNDCDGTIDFFFDEDCGAAFPARCERTLSFPRYALSDGEKLFIADGGNDRVLVFNEIPLENGAAADVVLGQSDFQTTEESTGAARLRAPSSLASDGTNLYVADPFSRRVLVFTPAEDQIAQDGLVNGAAFQIPASGFVFLQGDLEAGQETTVVIGPRQYQHVAVEGDDAEDAVAFLIEEINAEPEAVVTVSPAVSSGEHASGTVTFDGEIQAGDRLTLNVGDETYEVEVQADDQPFVMVDRFVNEIRANGNSVFFPLRDTAGDVLNRLRVVFRDVGPQGNGIPYSMTASPGALITFELGGDVMEGAFQAFGFRAFAKEPGPEGNSISIQTQTSLDGRTAPSTSGQLLTGGSDARELPVGTIATIFGTGFSDQIWDAQSAIPNLPTELGGVQVFVNGVLAPLYSVMPEQINFQVPFETMGTTMSVYVRRVHDDGTVTVSAPRASRVARASPGLFAFPGPEPRQAIAVHGSGIAQGSVAVTQTQTLNPDNDGVDAGITLTITVQGRDYNYVTVQGDTAFTVRDGLVAAINAGDGDPDVLASASQEGFFSARADITISGEIQAGDVVTITINGRVYPVVVREADSVTSIRNLLVEEINSGQGDPEVSARRLAGFDPDAPILQVVARSLGEDGNDIAFTVTVNDGALITATTNAEDGFLQFGQAPPIVLLTGRISGREANEIEFSAASDNTAVITASTRASTLCCGNEPFSLITPENPAVPGESIVLFATGLGQTAPTPQSLGISSGEPIPSGELLNVPFNALDFVSSLVDRRSAVIQFVGLMPGQIGVYQINMRINEGLSDNPAAPLTIAQVLFISNVVTIPIKNLRPRDDAI
jgi:uncharacterized protein (TIGR03437 family)